jgi:hypothetical protein
MDVASDKKKWKFVRGETRKSDESIKAAVGKHQKVHEREVITVKAQKKKRKVFQSYLAASHNASSFGKLGVPSPVTGSQPLAAENPCVPLVRSEIIKQY